MKILMSILAVIFILIAVSAMALECPDDSLVESYNDGQGNYSFEYSCDNGVKTRVISMTQETTDEKLVEMVTGKKCLQHNDILICR